MSTCLSITAAILVGAVSSSWSAEGEPLLLAVNESGIHRDYTQSEPSPSAATTLVAAAASYSDSAAASATGIHDLRLLAGFLPDHNEANGNEADWDHNLGIGVQYLDSPISPSEAGGFIWGIEGMLDNGSRSANGDRTSYYGLMANIMVGWGYQLPTVTNLHFEATPFFGIGAAHYTDTIGGSPTAFSYDYGVRLAGYWTFSNQFQAGLDLRLMDARAKPEFGGSIGGQSLNTRGIAVLFSVGKRL